MGKEEELERKEREKNKGKKEELKRERKERQKKG